MSHNTLNTLKEFPLQAGQTGQFYSLPALGEAWA
jgi:aconitate hydratase